jgi:type IX secretion system PorP/SprF family membrane protein
MINRLTIILLISLIATKAMAQQEQQYSHNMFNHMGFNPGFAGLSNAICVTALARQQWVGFKDSEGFRPTPESYSISVDGTVTALRGGIGGGVVQDKIGYYTINDVQLGYAYHRRIREGRLGIGLQVNFINTVLDAGKFLAVDETDPILNSLGGSDASNMMFDLNFGLFYTRPGEYYLGLSSTRLLQSSKAVNEGGGAYINFRRHFFLTAGYNYKLGDNQEYDLMPSVFIKSDGASIQMDISALLMVKERFWGGLSFRPQDAFALMVGVAYNDMRLGYSYDLPLTALGSTGSHEIMVNYCFKLELEQFRRSFRNTRYL